MEAAKKIISKAPSKASDKAPKAAAKLAPREVAKVSKEAKAIVKLNEKIAKVTATLMHLKLSGLP